MAMVQNFEVISYKLNIYVLKMFFPKRKQQKKIVMTRI